MIKLFAFIPFAMTGLLAGIEPSNVFIEYGALGICAFAVAMLFRQLTDMRASHRSEREGLVKVLEAQNEVHQKERKELMATLLDYNKNLTNLIEAGIRSDDLLSAALRNIKCLVKDE